MRFTNHLLATASIAALLAGTACQSAHKTKVLPPSQANAPALNASSNGAAAGDANLRQLDAASATQTTDPAALLVESVEKEYQSGQASYKTGDEDAAREAYAQALDLLVATPLDVEADPRLRHELDQVLAAMRKLDLQDQQPDDAAAQKSEPAPIDEANEASAPVDAKVKAKAEAEVKVTHSDLPLMMTDPVAGYINYFSGRGRPILERALVRSGRYEEMIRQILAEEGVPQDLIYLAQAESGFHPLALSRAGARGMWQFMGSRAKGYGLERNRWVDERQDPQASTRAAAEHLKDLYHQFGDWYLAMAAYNSGPGAVTSAVKRTGYADFWELYRRNVLPRETKNYVPIILAMTIMAKNPAQYGLNDLVLDKPVPHDTVQIDYAVDLRLVAQCVDASPDALQDLNPSLLRWSTPPDEPFDLHLPAGTKEQYLSAIARIPQDMRIWWRYHKVDSGDTLASIARSYHITSKAIAEANNLDREASLAPDTRLVIPLKPNRRASEVRTYARGAIRYRVRRGDTVASVARNFNVPPTLVRRWNRLRGNSLYRRHILYIHLPVTPGTRPELASRAGSKPKSTKALLAQASGKGVVHHRVKRGETLSSIASTHHTTVTALTRDNGIHRRSTLHPGMILIIRPQ